MIDELPITRMSPDDLLPLHDDVDDAKVAELTAGMHMHGWQGAPLVYAIAAYGNRALTGSHRRAAAQAAGIDIPVVDIEELMAAHGRDWQALVTEHCSASTWDPVYNAACDLREHLPADVADHYGLDAGGL